MTTEAYSRLGGDLGQNTMLPLLLQCRPNEVEKHAAGHQNQLWLLGAQPGLHLGPDSLQREDLIGGNWSFLRGAGRSGPAPL